MTRQQKVLKLLIEAKSSHWHVIPIHHNLVTVSEDGCVYNWALCAPETGGLNGRERLRELRANGIQIEMKRINGSGTYCYRLVTDPSDIDFDKCKVKEG